MCRCDAIPLSYQSFRSWQFAWLDYQKDISLTDLTIESLRERESIIANIIAKLTTGKHSDTSDIGNRKDSNTGSRFVINTKRFNNDYGI